MPDHDALPTGGTDGDALPIGGTNGDALPIGGTEGAAQPDRSRYAELTRPPLSQRSLAAALLSSGSVWTSLRVVQRTGSSNADLLAEAGRGAPAGQVLIAEQQTAGRGRLDRRWESPPRSGLTVSFLLRPAVPKARWSWLPLLTGVALLQAVSRLAAIEAELKWPNDVLVEDRKLAGILATMTGDAVVIGFGLNVHARSSELPAGAVSLTGLGAACTDRDPLCRAILRRVAEWYQAWLQADGDPAGCGLLAAYTERCGTIGHFVRAEVMGSDPVLGTASGIDSDGRLVLATDAGDVVIAAADVTRVRRGDRTRRRDRSC